MASPDNDPHKNQPGEQPSDQAWFDRAADSEERRQAAQAARGPEDAGDESPLSARFRRGMFAAKAALDQTLSYAATRDVVRATDTDHYPLRGEKTTRKPQYDVLTGKPITEEDKRERGTELHPEVHHYPRIPKTDHQHTHFYAPHKAKHESRQQGSGEVHSHRLFKDLAENIEFGKLRGAMQAYDAIQRHMRDGADAYEGPVAKLANRMLPADRTRGAFLRNMYTESNHTAYEAIMSVENSPIKGRDEDRTWEEELNLRNIQALRSRIMEKWLLPPEQNHNPMVRDEYNSKAKEGYDPTTLSRFESGGIYKLETDDVATYLGVEKEKLRAQIFEAGEKVVPPEVLTKLNFFFQYADNNLPEGELSNRLALFRDDEPYNTESGPIKRLHDVDEALQAKREGLAPLLNPGIVVIPKLDVKRGDFFARNYDFQNTNRTSTPDGKQASAEAGQRLATQREAMELHQRVQEDTETALTEAQTAKGQRLNRDELHGVINDTRRKVIEEYLGHEPTDQEIEGYTALIEWASRSRQKPVQGREKNARRESAESEEQKRGEVIISKLDEEERQTLYTIGEEARRRIRAELDALRDAGEEAPRGKTYEALCNRIGNETYREYIKQDLTDEQCAAYWEAIKILRAERE